jgi:hypothetical protein
MIKNVPAVEQSRAISETANMSIEAEKQQVAMFVRVLMAEVDSHDSTRHQTTRQQLESRAHGLAKELARLDACGQLPKAYAVENWGSSGSPALFYLKRAPGNPRHRSMKQLRSETTDPLYRQLLSAQVGGVGPVRAWMYVTTPMSFASNGSEHTPHVFSHRG